MAELLLGPFLRGSPDALGVWVEVDRACEVEVLDRRARTFCIAGHHYALVDLRGLPPGSDVAYEVRLDGRRAWPPEQWLVPPRIRTWDGHSPYRIVTGSCRQSAPHAEPYTKPATEHVDGLGHDALLGIADQFLDGTRPWPDLLLLGGDQVYADEPHPSTAEAVERRRRGPRPRRRPPVVTFEEFTWLYQETWRDPRLQRLLASVPTVMVFDDHDVIDDWNTSEAWRQRVERLPWWQDRVRSALAAYWVYQHLGNVGVVERHDRQLFEAVLGAEDGWGALREFAALADQGTPGNVGHRWSYRCDAGPCRLLVVDSRNGRVLGEEARSMLDDAEWAWLDEHATGGVDHLVLATSVPWLLPPTLHRLEAWDEALVRGAWGRRAAALGERARQAVDLEHWAAFGESFQRLGELVGQVSRGERGPAPRSVTVLSGDLHFGYTAEVDLGGDVPVRQLVTSPLRQASEAAERKVQRWAMRQPCSALMSAALRLVGPRSAPPWEWRVVDGPWFDNNVATLVFERGTLRVTVERAVDDGRGSPALETLADAWW